MWSKSGESRRYCVARCLTAFGYAAVPVLDVGTLASLQLITSKELVLAAFLGDVTGAAEMLFGVLVVDKELAVLAIAVGLVASDGDQAEDAGCLLEDDVHLLQRPVGCLGVEEIDDREDERVTKKWLVMRR